MKGGGVTAGARLCPQSLTFFLSRPPSPTHHPIRSRAEGLRAPPVMENYPGHVAAGEGAQVSSFRWQVPFLSLCPSYVNFVHNQPRAINSRLPRLCVYSQQCLSYSFTRAMVSHCASEHTRGLVSLAHPEFLCLGQRWGLWLLP